MSGAGRETRSVRRLANGLEATLKLKQGLGRLIRSEEDRGVVLILDNRILSHGYGRVMISSLPECYIPEDASLGNIASKIERFLY